MNLLGLVFRIVVREESRIFYFSVFVVIVGDFILVLVLFFFFSLSYLLSNVMVNCKIEENECFIVIIL